MYFKETKANYMTLNYHVIIKDIRIHRIIQKMLFVLMPLLILYLGELFFISASILKGTYCVQCVGSV